MFLRYWLLFCTVTGLLLGLFLPIDTLVTHGSPAEQSDPLYNLIVHVTACDAYTNLPDSCLSAEQGSGLLIDASGIILTAYHLTDKKPATDGQLNSETTNQQTQDEWLAALEHWPIFEVAFGPNILGCDGDGRCKADLLAVAPDYDMALLKLRLSETDFAEELQSITSGVVLNYAAENIDPNTVLQILGYPEKDSFTIQNHQIESFNQDSASITITTGLQRGFSGAPAIAQINRQPSLVGIVSRLDTPNGSQTIIRTLNQLRGFQWRTEEGISEQPQQFAEVFVEKVRVPNDQVNVEILNFSTLMMAKPQSELTLLLYLFDEQYRRIPVDQERSWPTSSEAQLIWEQPLDRRFLVKSLEKEIDISDIFDLKATELETVSVRLIMVDQNNRLIWSHEEWVQINRPQTIPTPEPTPDPRLIPVDVSTLSGRIAFTRLRNDDVWLTEMYCLQTNLPCQPLEYMRQPDFDSEGRLLVNGAGNGKDDIVRMDAYFGQDKLLSRHPEDQRPHWSPFGDQFVYDSTFYGDGNSRIYIQSSLGRIDEEPKSAVFAGIDFIGHYPIFLSDGRIAYQGCDRWRHGGRLCGILVSEVPPFAVPLRITDRTDDLPTDRLGGRILFTSKRTGNWDAYSVNPNGTGIVNLTNHPADDGLAAASPDNQHIAFYSNRDGQGGIYIARADGSGTTLLQLIEGSDKKVWQDERLSWGP